MKRIVKTLQNNLLGRVQNSRSDVCSNFWFLPVFYLHTNDCLVILFIAKKNSNCDAINDKLSSNTEQLSEAYEF